MIAMVSNMSVLQFPNPYVSAAARKCNRCAVLCRGALVVALAFYAAFPPITLAAQSSSATQTVQLPSPAKRRVVDSMEFLAGGALGLGIHESGHLVFDGVF